MGTLRAIALPALLFLFACSSCTSLGLGGGGFEVRETAGGGELSLGEMARQLAQADVVFLGEEHDNDVGHDLQLRTLRLLAEERPRIVLSLEQFEADVQGPLDDYLTGRIDEATFLESSRPWPNYNAHYRPMVELARRRGWPVLAANVPRPLASRVAKEGGLYAVGHEPLVPWEVWVEEPEYADLFARAMGRRRMRDDDWGLQRWFAAQCVKDEKMAESIADFLSDSPAGERPLVVHLCGKFHSNYRLGTVSRLQRRLPELDLRVVSMISGPNRSRELGPEERRLGDYVWLVPPQRD